MGRETKLSKIFVSYSASLKHFISRIVRSEDIEDIIQETFVRSYEADLKQEIQYARSYMLKTAKNLALNHVAKWDNKFNHSIELQEKFPEVFSGRYGKLLSYLQMK